MDKSAVDALKREIEKDKTDLRATESEHSRLKSEIDKKKQEISQIESKNKGQIDSKQKEIESKQRDIANLENQSKSEIDRKTQEKTKLETDLHNAESKIGQLKTSMQQRDSDLRTLQQELDKEAKEAKKK